MKPMRFQCDSIDFLGVGVSISWEEWMPSSKYEAIVTPYEHRTSSCLAIIESFTPLDCSSSNYTLEVWIPVKKSE